MTKEELVAELKSWLGEAEGEAGDMHGFEYLFRLCLTHLQSDNWISVEDRLPEDDVPVLVTSKWWPDQISAAMITRDVGGWAWTVAKGYFMTLNDIDSYEFDDGYEFSHWQPLPLPPQDKE